MNTENKNNVNCKVDCKKNYEDNCKIDFKEDKEN